MAAVVKLLDTLLLSSRACNKNYSPFSRTSYSEEGSDMKKENSTVLLPDGLIGGLLPANGLHHYEAQMCFI